MAATDLMPWRPALAPEEPATCKRCGQQIRPLTWVMHNEERGEYLHAGCPDGRD